MRKITKKIGVVKIPPPAAQCHNNGHNDIDITHSSECDEISQHSICATHISSLVRNQYPPSNHYLNNYKVGFYNCKRSDQLPHLQDVRQNYTNYRLRKKRPPNFLIGSPSYYLKLLKIYSCFIPIFHGCKSW